MKIRLPRSSPILLMATLAAMSGCARRQPPPAAVGYPAPAASPSGEGTGPAPVAVLPHPVLDRLEPGRAGSIADVAERVTASVVSVHTTKVLPAPEAFPGFGIPFGLPPGFGDGSRRAPGMGSGVVVAAGVVVTNHHVVADAAELRVTDRTGREYDVELAGSDEKSDLAVLRILGDQGSLVPLPMGSSSKLRLGDVVLAIGNPFGVGQTVTMGIVSAKGRADLGINAYEDFIQTDAAINPGNSGGALVDMAGELVGINSAILSRSGGNQGIGFAIPTDMARPIVESLLASGKVSRGRLGVGIQDLDAELAAALGLPAPRGVLVVDVEPGAPAAAAGLRRGDVILSVNGQEVDSTGRLRNLIASAGANGTARLALLRDGRRVESTVRLAELADETERTQSSQTRPTAGKPLDGLTVEPLTDATRRRFSVPPGVKSGVVVTAIARGSAAAEAGLRPGDVILEIDRKPVPTVERFAAAWSAGKARRVVVVSRGGAVRFLVVGG